MIWNRKVINDMDFMTLLNKIKKWCLLDSGIIKQCYANIDNGDGTYDRDIIIMDRDKQGLSTPIGHYSKSSNGTILHSISWQHILAMADTKKELIQLKRELDIRNKRSMTKKEVDRLIELVNERYKKEK